MADEYKMSGGSIGWKMFNTIAASAGIALGATALGVKCGEEKVREIARREDREGYNYGRGRGEYGDGCESGCFEERKVNHFELRQSQEISELRAEKCADKGDDKLAEKFSAIVAGLAAKIDCVEDKVIRECGKLDKDMAVERVNNEWQMKFVNKGFAEVNEEIGELRHRVNAITKEVVPISAICPQPLSGCVPLHIDGREIRTFDDDCCRRRRNSDDSTTTTTTTTGN